MEYSAARTPAAFARKLFSDLKSRDSLSKARASKTSNGPTIRLLKPERARDDGEKPRATRLICCVVSVVRNVRVGSSSLKARRRAARAETPPCWVTNRPKLYF